MKEEYKHLLEEYIKTNTIYIPGKLEAYIEKIINRATIINYYASGEFAGFIAYYNNDLQSGLAFITMVAVGSNFAGKGIGTLLLRASIDDVKKAGFRKFNLEVLKNSAAKKLYEKFDFEIIEERESSYIMSKSL